MLLWQCRTRQIYRHCCCKICEEVVSFSRPVMRNHDIASSSSVKRFFLYMFFILVYETAKWYKSSQDKNKQYHQIILGISILCNDEDWRKTWFIRREITKMTPVISRHISCTIIETKNYRTEVQCKFAFRKHVEIIHNTTGNLHIMKRLISGQR